MIYNFMVKSLNYLITIIKGMSVSLTNGCTHRSKHLLVLELLTLYFDLIKGSVYFKVFALIEAA